MQISLLGSIPSSKNSKRIFRAKGGKTFLANSKTVQKYLDEFEYQWYDEENIKKFKEMIKDKKPPYKIGFYFIRATKHKFDYINALQLPQDLMVKYGWLNDDNCDEIIPVILGYEYDPNKVGSLLITVIDND